MRVLPLLITLLWLPVAAAANATAPLKQVQLLVRVFPGDARTLAQLRLRAAATPAREGNLLTSADEKQLALLAALPVVNRAVLSTQDDVPAQVETRSTRERTVLQITPDVQPDSSAVVSLSFTREVARKPSGAPFRGSCHLRVGETLAAAPEPGVIVAVTLIEIEVQPEPAAAPKPE